MVRKIAYLAQGKLFHHEDGKSELINSAYGQDVIKRALERQAKNDWKTGGANAGGLYNRRSLWGVEGENPAAINVKITAVTPGDTEDELMYVVSTESVGGLFKYNTKTQKETRIFHKEQLYLSDFARQGDLIACCQRFASGIASLSLVQGNSVDQATEGDSVDESPSWIPDKKQLVYQSAGVARNQSGIMVGIGHTFIQKLDLEKGTVDTVLEDESFDFLCPKMNREGELFCIRRPYETPYGKAYPIQKIFLDAVLLPFRLCRALFHFLNFFSLTFSKKPLTTANGPKVEGPDEKTLFLRGRMINAEEMLKEKKTADENPSLVPKNWQLVKRDSAGNVTILADAVLAFDMAADGSIVYTNGMSVYAFDPVKKERTFLFKDKLVDHVLVLN